MLTVLIKFACYLLKLALSTINKSINQSIILLLTDVKNISYTWVILLCIYQISQDNRLDIDTKLSPFDILEITIPYYEGHRCKFKGFQMMWWMLINLQYYVNEITNSDLLIYYVKDAYLVVDRIVNGTEKNWCKVERPINIVSIQLVVEESFINENFKERLINIINKIRLYSWCSLGVP